MIEPSVPAPDVAPSRRAATPILDLDQPMPAARQGFSIGLSLVPFPSIWLYNAMLGGLPQHTRSVFMTGLPVALLMLAIVFYSMIVVHESGHLVGGLIGRYRLHTFRVPPIAIVRTASGYRLRPASLSQPYTAMTPPANDSWRARAGFAVAGPAANLIFAIVAVGLVIFLHPVRYSSDYLLLSLVYFAGGFSFCVGIANLVPAYERRLPTDGAVLADALERNARFERSVALGRMIAALQSGTRSDALDPADVERAQHPADRSLNAMRAHLIAYAARVKNDVDAGAIALEAALASTRYATIAERASVAIEAVIYHAWYRRDERRATSWLRHAGKCSPLTQTRIDISMAWARGDVAGAIARIEAAIANMAHIARGASLELMTSIFQEWLADARKAAPSIATE